MAISVAGLSEHCNPGTEFPYGAPQIPDVIAEGYIRVDDEASVYSSHSGKVSQVVYLKECVVPDYFGPTRCTTSNTNNVVYGSDKTSPTPWCTTGQDRIFNSNFGRFIGEAFTVWVQNNGGECGMQFVFKHPGDSQIVRSVPDDWICNNAVDPGKRSSL